MGEVLALQWQPVLLHKVNKFSFGTEHAAVDITEMPTFLPL